MAINKLTDSRIAAAKPKEKQYSLSDGGGLSLRVRPTGSKTWVYVFHLDGNQRRMGLGSYPAVGLAEARKGRDDARKVRETENPILARKKAKEAARREARGDGPPKTVRQLFEKWQEVELTQRKDLGARTETYFERDVFPVIGDKPLVDVTQADIWAIRDRMRATKRPRRAADADGSRLVNMHLSDLRQMFNFGVSRGYSNVQPTAGIRSRDYGGQDQASDRWLTEPELQQLAKILPTSRLSKVSQCAVWLLLATGNRVGESYKARWSEISFEGRTWFIPKENRKGNRLNPAKDHLVCLSDFALGQLRLLEAHTGDSPFLFPNKRDRRTAAPDNSLRRQVADLSTSLYTGGQPWTPHDLRRSTATLLLSVGTTQPVADKCIGHYARGDRVASAYFHWGYEDERVQAWEKLGRKLGQIMQTSEAVTVPAAPRT